jgi:hypothetical protein
MNLMEKLIEQVKRVNMKLIKKQIVQKILKVVLDVCKKDK